jgi:hypothetical protein
MPDDSVDSSTETPLTFTTPSLARRMACWFYEGMLLFGVIFLAGYLFGTLSQTKHALDNRHGLQAFLFLVFAIYFTWLWSKGQTHFNGNRFCKLANNAKKGNATVC